ncbi:hypothetical protein SAMN05444000_11342 [Shimia gijangensis]|uniref:Uncharacterized protein n=1 Tax=Shimia gijangensis TaxID=1470563 RepID=A0A1M6M6Q4_9RHOB|nr:hypothetical protein [Shimia gijangensis]SHJ79128.1 hypothetical protein SAMN05444000_11342 [Shimia gijangensis]
MAFATQLPARFSNAFGVSAFFKGFFRAEHVPHWTEYLRDSHRV